MMSRRLPCYVWVMLLSMGIAGCGKSSNNSGNPGGPSGGTSCSSVGVLGAAKGTINATVDGATFNGGISPGNGLYTPLPALGPGLAPADFFVINAVCGDGSSIVITARAGSWQNGIFVLGRPGQTQIGVDVNGNALRDPQTQQPLPHIIQYIQVRNGAAAGGWVVSVAAGSGSITLNSVSNTVVSGSFVLTMAPSSGGATGTKQVQGTFSATF